MNTVDEAVKSLKNGGIGIFPTDTAFGIGCRIDNEKAVERLFQARKRPQDKAVPVLVSSIQMAQEWVEEFDNEVLKLMETYWPGGLTIVLPAKVEKIPPLVRGGGNTIGVRMPNHPTALSIIEKVGVPILGPSANFAGDATPFDFTSLDKNLLQLVDFAVDGECSLKKASTVIDCTKKPWTILRQGAVEVNSKFSAIG